MKKILLSTVLALSSWVLFAQDTTKRHHRDTTKHRHKDTTSISTTINPMNPSTNDQQMHMNDAQMNTSTDLNGDETTTTNQMSSATSTSNYSAYGIPSHVQTNFQAQHPNVTNLTWESPTADWYHGYYSDANGRYTHIYYSTDPYYNAQFNPERIMGYTVALPVLQTWVPDEIITTATNLYKQNLYDITLLKATDNHDVYQVRVQDNGELKSIWMDEHGMAVTDYYRTEEPIHTGNTTDTHAAMNDDTHAAMKNEADHNPTIKTKIKKSDGSVIKKKKKGGHTKKQKGGHTSHY